MKIRNAKIEEATKVIELMQFNKIIIWFIPTHMGFSLLYRMTDKKQLENNDKK